MYKCEFITTKMQIHTLRQIFKLQLEIKMRKLKGNFLVHFYNIGIPPHVDTHSAFEDAIISLSLGAEVWQSVTKQATHIVLHSQVDVFIKKN